MSFNQQDWQTVSGGIGAYHLEITAEQHGRGATTNLIVYAVEPFQGGYRVIDVDTVVEPTGLVILYANERFSGRAYIAGGIAEMVDTTARQEIADLREQVENTEHFRGSYNTLADVEKYVTNPHPGDYVYIPGDDGNTYKWNWDEDTNSWKNTNVVVADQTVPKGTTMPLPDGTAALGDTNTYADAAHVHPERTDAAHKKIYVGTLNSDTNALSLTVGQLKQIASDMAEGQSIVVSAEGFGEVLFTPVWCVNSDTNIMLGLR